MRRRQPSRQFAESAPWLPASLALALLGLGCGPKTLTLGDAPSAIGLRLGSPRRVPELLWPDKAQNPSLTDDSLELLFTSTRGDTKLDIWRAERSTRSEPFSTLERVDELCSEEMDTSTAVSGDGLSIWFGSARAGGLGDVDIWVAQRASRGVPWAAPVNAAAINTAHHDIPRPPALAGTVLLVSSDRAAPGAQDDVYLAARTDTQRDFEAPEPGAQLRVGALVLNDPFLTNDGLTLFFSSDSVTGNADLFVAYRPALEAAFTSYSALNELNSSSAEHDPFLTADGSRLYFASDREGPLNVYDAEVLTGP